MEQRGGERRNFSKEQVDVTDFYDRQKVLSFSERQQSRMVHGRNFHNWIKSVLIDKAITKISGPASVLDFCGGKGGDLLKWKSAGISQLVLVDISLNSVRNAAERYSDSSRGRPTSDCFPAMFIAADCFKPGFLAQVPPDIRFDLVSCQFALHYSFESEERARGMLQNVTERLNPGGFFVATIPNANYIVKSLRQAEGLSFGNSIFSVRFEQKEEFPMFGGKYYFTLEEAVGNVPEYLVHFPTLVKLAEEYGLKLEYQAPFHQFYQEHVKDRKYLRLLNRMRCLDESGSLEKENWEVSALYMAFIFRKEGRSQPNNPVPYRPKRGAKPNIIDLISKELQEDQEK